MGFKRPARSQPERTGQEDRGIKFYELRDNLLAARRASAPAPVLQLSLATGPTQRLAGPLVVPQRSGDNSPA
jgi:hypothetical protein